MDDTPTNIAANDEVLPDKESQQQIQMVELPPELRESDSINPRRWAKGKKVFYSLGMVITVFAVTNANSIYVASIPGVEAKFQISQTLAISGVTLYSIGFALGPAVGTASSEVFGRQYIFKILLGLCLLFTIVGGVSNNFATLAVSRLLAGIFGSPCITIALGVLHDLWPLMGTGDKIGDLMLLSYGLSINWAPELGPVIGETIVQDRDWRWTFWMSAIFIAVSFLMTVSLPETFVPQILRRLHKSEGPQQSRQDINRVFLVAISRPIHLLVTEPIVFPTALLVTISQVVLFVIYVAYPYILRAAYDFSNYSIGISFLALFIGSTLAIPVLGIMDKRYYQPAKAEAEAKGEQPLPELRLYPAMLGSITLPISLFWFAWTARPNIHWIVPIISGVVYGFSFTLLQISIPIYRSDVYGTHLVASSMAADQFLRYLVSSIFPLFTFQMITNLTFPWAMSLLGFVSLITLPVPWLFMKWGPALRKRSKYVEN